MLPDPHCPKCAAEAKLEEEQKRQRAEANRRRALEQDKQYEGFKAYLRKVHGLG